MTIPDRPLEIKLSLDGLAVHDVAILNSASLSDIYRFLVECSNWTRQEVGKLTIDELRAHIVPMITRKLYALAIPPDELRDLKDWSRKKQLGKEKASPPAWVLDFRYAERYGCHPHEVKNIPVVWWLRWIELCQADDAREAFDSMADGKPNERQKAAIAWALKDDY